MSGILLLLILVALATAALWSLGVRGAMLKLSAAAFLLGGAGYAFQGRPDLRGAPARQSSGLQGVTLAKARHAFFGEFNASERWLLIADSFSRRGKHSDAAAVMANAVRRYPGDLRLWLGFASALVEDGKGLSPPAQLAFARAEELAPRHPATGFFHGLALVRSGQAAAGLARWRAVLSNAPADAAWRPLVEDAVAAVSASTEAEALRPRR